MSRLRRYFPVLAYLVGLPIVGTLQDNGTFASDAPSILYGGFGLAWLIVFIWRNRAGGAAEVSCIEADNSFSDDRSAYGSGDWTIDSSSAQYWTDGPGRSTY